MREFRSPRPWDLAASDPRFIRNGSLALAVDPALPLFKGFVTGGLISSLFWIAAILPLLP